MTRLHRDTVTYWVFVAAIGAFNAFNVVVLALMLPMSTTGRVQGGVSLNVVVTIDAFLWACTMGAFDAALWKLRLLPEDTKMVSLARRGRPADPVVANAWRWMRAAWIGWLSFVGLMFATALITWVFDPWRGTV
jgi:hypothetical protein